jgi:tetratricopeptide (TPR) repeat protein
MTQSALGQDESRTLAQAAEFLNAGNAQQAAMAVTPLIVAGNRHPDVLMLYSAACERLGKVRDALGAVQAALESAPERADIWANLGRMLHEQGQSERGAEILERAVQLDPAKAEPWYNLGLAASGAGKAERAEEALRQATRISPSWAMAWAALGQVQLGRDELEQAESSLRKALDIDPNSKFAKHTMSIVLRRQDRAEEGLSLIGHGRDQPPETLLMRAHLMGDLGRLEDAAEAYRELIRDRPDILDAHETLARLLPLIGAGDAAFDSYRHALAKQPTPELYRSAITTARDLKDALTMLEWSDDALRHYGRQPDLLAFRGLALGMHGDSRGALAELEPLAKTGFDPVLGHCAYYRLKLGDLRAAEEYALAATEKMPLDQAAWSYLTIIWRLLNDPRESWLADYERLVMPIAIEPPEGFATIESFMAELADDLRDLHSSQHHPLEQSLRHGTQTRALLFIRRIPTVQALAAQLEKQIENKLAELPMDEKHPFLGRNTRRLRFAGSWSVRLRSGGFHISHIHHTGWISSALYVSLPDQVAALADGTIGQGALTFGIPDENLGLELTPRRVETPRVGRLVIFPSYFWHGTIPFESEQPRLTVAFDALPA